MEKLEAIEDNDKTVEALVNITKPRTAEILVIYRKTVRVQTAKDTLQLDHIVALNASRFLKNSALV